MDSAASPTLTSSSETNDTTGGSSEGDVLRSDFVVVLEPLVVAPGRSVVRFSREDPSTVQGDVLFKGAVRFRDLVILKKSENFDLVSYQLVGYESYVTTANTYDPESKRHFDEKRTFFIVCDDLLPLQSRQRLADEFITAVWARCFGGAAAQQADLSDADGHSPLSDDAGALNGRVQQRFTAVSTLMNVMLVLRDHEHAPLIQHVDVDVTMVERKAPPEPELGHLSVKELIKKFNAWPGPCRA
ncbi:hypothetical protein M3Y99_00289000 [Aphelenchoides fujianensis]|nr:hypothetical protein M3Y99_00289000 [Aphelenchoides fujianensis]